MVIDCCVVILTCLFPPIGVFLVSGIGADLVINICLTILGFLPGHIHAFYILVQYASKPQPYQQVPANQARPINNGQYRQYDVYRPNQQQQQVVAPPTQKSGKDALVNDYKQQQQYAEASNTQPSYSQQQQPYKSVDNNPPPYKS